MINLFLFPIPTLIPYNTHMNRFSKNVIIGLCLSSCVLTAFADEITPPKSEKTEIENLKKNTPSKKPKNIIKLPGITINLKEKYVDLQTQVTQFDGRIELELLLCMPGTLEHESLFKLNAKASHLHQALLMIGLKPGKPQQLIEVGDKYKLIPIKGQKAQINIIFTKKGKTKEFPIGDWLYNPVQKIKMKDSTWVFAGSFIATPTEGKPYYRADIIGAVISLVNFGDEVLGKKTDKRNRGGGANIWFPKIGEVPKIGTKVTLRIRPVKPSKKQVKPSQIEAKRTKSEQTDSK